MGRHPVLKIPDTWNLGISSLLTISEGINYRSNIVPQNVCLGIILQNHSKDLG